MIKILYMSLHAFDLFHGHLLATFLWCVIADVLLPLSLRVERLDPAIHGQTCLQHGSTPTMKMALLGLVTIPLDQMIDVVGVRRDLFKKALVLSFMRALALVLGLSLLAARHRSFTACI